MISTIALARENVRRAVRKAGWPGVAGMVMAVLAAVTLGVSDARTSGRRAELASQRAQVTRDAPMPAVTVSGGARGGSFAPIPPSAQLPALLAQLYDSASRAGISVERAEYQRSEENGTPFERVGLQLPIRGEFSTIYRWLQQTLTAMPGVALETFDVRRTDMESGSVEADVRLQIFLRRTL